MELEFIPIDYDYFDYGDKNYIKIVGQSRNGKKICVIDDFEPNFWAILNENVDIQNVDKLVEKIKKIEALKGSRLSKVLRVEKKKKNFLGKEVDALQIFVTNHKDCHAIAHLIGDSKEIFARREYDISIITKYIMQGGLKPLVFGELKGDVLAEGDFGGIAENINCDVCIKKTSFKEGSKKEEEFKPKVLAYDIECEIGEIGKGKILMIGLYGEDFQKIFTYKNVEKKGSYVEVTKNEKEMITRFIEEVNFYNPDVICGYFSDGYDLPFLKERAKKNNIKLNLGIDGSEVKFTRGVFPTGKIKGIVHVDIYRFIAAVFSQYLASETLSLKEVSGELVGETKGDFDFLNLKKMNDKLWEEFFSYNLRDVEITYKLFHKIWPDLMEFSRIVGEPPFNISRDTMATSVENYILHNLDRFNEIAEKNPISDEIMYRRSMGKYEGAFVFEPTPGMYEDVAMFDFTSMYGSVIVSYNLSRSTFIGGDEKDGFKFSKERGFFPTMLSEFIDLRKKYKKEYATKKDNMSKARSNAYKLLANAAYGYLGFFGARYYSREAASSTTRLAKENILLVIEKIKKEGYQILYSDTDSIAFSRGEKSKKEIKEFLSKLNEKLPGIMELDLEGFFKRGLFVSKRSKESGAKKKYALIDEEGNLKIRGFETVRRDWCQLARSLQSKIIKRVLEEGNERKAEEILKKCVQNLRERKIDKKDLIIRTQLRKIISEYTATGPHVVAAKKMRDRGDVINVGMLVEYYIGEGKGKRVGDRVKLMDEEGNYDIDYYLNNQILPAVENIFEVFDVKVEDILDGQKQTELFDF